MKKQNQKGKDWLKGILLILLLFIIAGVCLYFYGTLQRKKDAPVNVAEVKDTIDKYGYSLNDNVTDYYQNEFDILKEMASDTSKTDEDIANQVAKLFIIDLYSINYKINKYEVTSAQYFYSDKQDMHKQKVIDKLYNLVEDNAYADRKQDLPEVSDVTIIKTTKGTYKLGEKEVTSYIVNLNINYVKDLGYDKVGKVILVKDTNNVNMSVVNYANK